MSAHDLRTWLASASFDAKEGLKFELGHGGDTDAQFVNHFIAEPALRERARDRLREFSRASRVTKAAITAPVRERIAIYLAAASFVFSMIAILIALSVKPPN